MQRKRSLFGPLLLIAAGVVWLLVQSGTIPAANLWALTYIWPFLLIAAGLGIILRTYWSYVSIVLDVVLIGGALLAILYAPQLGWTSPSTLFTINIGDDSFIGPAERGSGNVVTEARNVSDFHAVDISYPAQVLVQQGTKESLKVEAEDNLLPGLKTQVKNGVLQVFYKTENGKHVNPTKPVKLTIIVKELTDVDFSSAGDLNIAKLNTDKLNISLSGAGNLKVDSIQTKQLGVDLSGAGSMNASGIADDLNLTISGFGGFKGGDLHSKSVRVEISGAGSATVWADNDLTAEVSGAGSVNYYGAAAVTKQISGVGGVKHLGNK